MATVLHIDPSSGVAGDMLLAALVDCGLDPGEFALALREALPGLPFEVRFEETFRKGIRALRADVRDLESDPPHRGLRDVLEVLDGATLPERARRLARAAFERLALVEARLHGTTPDDVHFHEVGAMDAIVDIAGVALAVARLEPDRITSGPVALGSGEIECDHGPLLAPAPATLGLLEGCPVRPTALPYELATPTGASLLSVLVDAFAMPGAFTLRKTGYGAGGRDIPERPNVIRALLGEVQPEGGEPVFVLETNLDDERGEGLGYLIPRLLEAGALDAWTVPILMKKGRPAHLVGALASESQRDAVARVILEETSTFGLRMHAVERRVLAREIRTVETALGPVRVKAAKDGGRVLKAAPEYEDCRALASRHGVPLRRVEELALRAFFDGAGGVGGG